MTHVVASWLWNDDINDFDADTEFDFRMNSTTRGQAKLDMHATCETDEKESKWHGTIDIEPIDPDWTPPAADGMHLVRVHVDRHNTAMLAGEEHVTWRSNVDLEGDPATFPLAGYPTGVTSTAVTRRVISSTVTVADSSGAEYDRAAWIELITRSPAMNSSQGGDVAGGLAISIWWGDNETDLPDRFEGPDLRLAGGVRVNCQYKCMEAPYIPVS